MVKTINAAVIGCNMSDDFFKTSTANTVEKFSWKKIFTGEHSSSFKTLPGAELVERAEAILHDSTIDLVFVSANHLHFVKPVIEAGKSVRVI